DPIRQPKGLTIGSVYLRVGIQADNNRIDHNESDDDSPKQGGSGDQTDLVRRFFRIHGSTSSSPQPRHLVLHGPAKVHRPGWELRPIRQFSAKRESRKVWIFFRKCGLLDLKEMDRTDRLRLAQHAFFQ
ncbi:MAG TPA: hypothetical protein VIT18_04750, partial [Terrimicrobiaceae bacterium]